MFVGFHRTGTGSLEQTFTAMRYEVLHGFAWRFGDAATIARYDVFLDGCEHDVARLLQAAPNARFVSQQRQPFTPRCTLPRVFESVDLSRARLKTRPFPKSKALET